MKIKKKMNGDKQVSLPLDNLSSQSSSGSETEEQQRGYLYVLYNPVYASYGNNVYKLGKALDCQQRLKGYVTSYLEPCEIKYQSRLIPYHGRGRTILFSRLRNFRMKKNREFFQCELTLIQKQIEEVSRFSFKNDTR